ncbi:putative breast carcinoma-amplified sequence 3 [Apostichopus japonicus]|uniref:Putative breast carcinoma-amplified sequence 3 n=1 Tax=Stichopus japonicus TaxID=307972 RepID=A0A2G8L300_STIJA|nr:putative breast carcinoma-amplified sequence 3 [Apostichopus japonicus]
MEGLDLVLSVSFQILFIILSFLSSTQIRLFSWSWDMLMAFKYGLFLCPQSSSRPRGCIGWSEELDNVLFISRYAKEQASRFTPYPSKHPSVTHCNERLFIVALREKVAAFDTTTFESKFCITTCYVAEPPNINPLALGTRWLAYADRNLIQSHVSNGGVARDSVQSYKATVIHAAKAIGKGLSAFTETVGKYASSRLSNSPPRGEIHPDGPVNSLQMGTPGVVTIIDTEAVNDEFNVTETKSGEGIIAHFQAYIGESISSLSFDPSGSLLFTAGSQGHFFHIFSIVSHPSSPGAGAVHHLYILYRGDTQAKVQDVSFYSDSRWVAVSTMRETTHVFPITPYGGPVGGRTHASPQIVNKESKFRRSAGLEELEATGRWSPVQGLSESPTSGFYGAEANPSSAGNTALGNPRIAPFPLPTTVTPLVQIKQPSILGSMSAVASTMTGSPARAKSPQHQIAIGDQTCIATCFSKARTFQYGGSKAGKDKHTAAVSLFIMNCHGTLVEQILEPRPPVTNTVTKKPEDKDIELVTSIHAQWFLQRGCSWPEFPPPLSSGNLLMLLSDKYQPDPHTSNSLCNSLSRSSSLGLNKKSSDFDEPWLSLVEMDSHAGPHRRLWMGPQFIFKPFSQPSSATVLSSSSSALLDDSHEAAERLQPQRSEPLNTPRPGRAELVRAQTWGEGHRPLQQPVLNMALVTIITVIFVVSNNLEKKPKNISPKHTNGSFDQTANLLEVSCGSCPDNMTFQRLNSNMEEHLKQTLAEAMSESVYEDQRERIHSDSYGTTVIEPLSSSPGSVDSFPHSYEARSSPTPIVDHVLVFPPNSSPET